MINNFVALFGGFHRFDNGGSKAVVFQFVDPFDCDSARCSHFVDFYAGVGVVVLNQCSSSFQGLRYHLHGVFGAESHFDAGLHSCLDIFQYVGNAAGSQCGGCCYFIFGNQHDCSHFAE